MGVYTQIKDNLLYTFFDSMCKSDEGVDDLGFKTNEGIKHLEELMTGIRYSELYKIFFKSAGGFYHNVEQSALYGWRMVPFEACDDECKFITSDNPALEYKSSVIERISYKWIYFSNLSQISNYFG